MKNKVEKIIIGARGLGKTMWMRKTHHETLQKYCRNFLLYCKDVEKNFCNVSDLLDDKIFECSHCIYGDICKTAKEIKEMRLRL